MLYHVMEWQTLLTMEIDCNVNYIIISCIKFRFFVLAVPRQLHSGNFSDMNNYFEIAIRNSYSLGRSCCKEFSLNTRVFWSDVQYRMIEMCGIRGKSWRTHTHWRMEMKPNEAVVYIARNCEIGFYANFRISGVSIIFISATAAIYLFQSLPNP